MNEAGRLAIDSLFDANKEIAALSKQVEELEAERDGLREAATAVILHTTIGETKDYVYPRWAWENLKAALRQKGEKQ